MTTVSFRDYRGQYDARLAQIAGISRAYVLAGIQEGTLTRGQVRQRSSTATIRRKQPGQNMAQIGYNNEFGIGVPERSFMRTSFDANRSALINIVDSQFDLIVSGNSTLRRSLNIIGLFVSSNIVRRINSIFYPPNSPRTIREKGSSKPLIDFGQMRQSITHRVFIG
jgi:hypothetical protein